MGYEVGWGVGDQEGQPGTKDRPREREAKGRRTCIVKMAGWFKEKTWGKGSPALALERFRVGVTVNLPKRPCYVGTEGY